MSPLSTTFSEVFDYPAYEEGTANGGSEGHGGDDKLEDGPTSDLPLDLSPARPLHDVRNVMSNDWAAPNGALRQGPAALLHCLFHEEENTPVPVSSTGTARRESTQPVLELPSSAAGPSRTASQLLIWKALEEMTSDFGSEFDGSDAMVDGGSERGSVESFLDDDCDEDEDEDEGFAAEEPFGEDDVEGWDEDGVVDGDDSEDDLSDSPSSEDEEHILECEPQGEDSDDEEDCSEDMGNCDEFAGDLPHTVPEPAPLEDVPASPISFLRRSTRVRRPPPTYVPPPPPPNKGKGKAIAVRARPAAPSRRTNLKRARSPSPVPGDAAYDVDAPSGSRPTKRRPQCSTSAVQAMCVNEPGVAPEVPCAVVGCGVLLSLDNIQGLQRHFRKHYAEKSTDIVRCRWGTECTYTHTLSEVLRHLRLVHLRVRFECPDCGKVLKSSRVDAITRHRDTMACKKRRGAS